MSADLAGFVGGLMTLSDICGGGRVSSEICESSPDDGMGPSLTSMAASAHKLEVSSIRELPLSLYWD